MRAGDHYHSTVSDTGFTIASVAKDQITVTLTRRVLNKSTGEMRVEDRTRAVPRPLWDFFLLAYKPGRKK